MWGPWIRTFRNYFRYCWSRLPCDIGWLDWQSQGVSNPCLRRERRAAHLMVSMGCVISEAIQVKNCTKNDRN